MAIYIKGMGKQEKGAKNKIQGEQPPRSGIVIWISEIWNANQAKCERRVIKLCEEPDNPQEDSEPSDSEYAMLFLCSLSSNDVLKIQMNHDLRVIGRII